MINNKVKVYIICPAYIATGGTELLHQLCGYLNKEDINAYMVYVDTNNLNKDVCPSEFKEYNTQEAVLQDTSGNIVIIPEAHCDYILNVKYARRFIWWLSVDNYFKKIKYIERKSKLGLRNKIVNRINKYLFNRDESSLIQQEIFNSFRNTHLVQSKYAEVFLNERNIKSKYLTDYINESFFSQSYFGEKRNFILYNPAKGLENIKYLFEEKVDGIWVPLSNMNRTNIIKLMQISKVYIDFGTHPGKDRFPREAALLGCCIITNRIGAAYYDEDINIEPEFKFENMKDKNLIVNKINDCLNDHEKNIKKFEFYINSIKSEKSKFETEVRNIFIKV